MGQIHRLELQEADCGMSGSCYSVTSRPVQRLPKLPAAAHCGRQTYISGGVLPCSFCTAARRRPGFGRGWRHYLVLQQTGQNPLQTDRVTATRELAKKIASIVPLQPQASPATGNLEVNLLKKHIELLQQQLTGFQQPTSDVSGQ